MQISSVSNAIVDSVRSITQANQSLQAAQEFQEAMRAAATETSRNFAKLNSSGISLSSSPYVAESQGVIGRSLEAFRKVSVESEKAAVENANGSGSLLNFVMKNAEASAMIKNMVVLRNGIQKALDAVLNMSM